MSRGKTKRRDLRPAVLIGSILTAALVVRVVFLSQLERSSFVDLLSLDSRFYRDLAHSILAGAGLPPGALTFNPLYPFFLAAVFKLFGERLIAARIIQALLGVLTVALVSRAGGRLVEGPWKGKPSSGLASAVAGCMAVLYAPFVLYEGMLVATAIEVFILTAACSLSLDLDHDLQGVRQMTAGGRRVPPWLAALALGGCLGAGALGRPNLFLLLAAALPVWLLVRNRRKGRGVAPAVACAVGSLVFLLPTIAYNARSSGELVPVTAHGGINFYIGNRPGTQGTYEPPPGMRGDMRGLIEDARMEAQAERGHPMSDAEVSNYYFRRAFEEIRGDPTAWLRLVGRKFLLFWNGAEVPDLPNAYFYAQASPALRLLFLPFAAIAPLGICGLVVLARSGRNRSVIFLFIGAGLVSVLLFFVNTRYRLPLVPVIILAAAFVIAWMAKEISRRRWRPVLWMAAIAAAFAVLVSARTLVRVNQSAAYTFIGNYYVDNKDEKRAGEAFAEAYRLDPNQVEAMINYARTLRRRGDVEEAAALYARAHSVAPGFPRLAAEYGSVLESLGRRDEARTLYLEALSSPRTRDRVLACQLLANQALAAGRRDEAAAWVKRALEMVPNDPKLTEMLRWLEAAK